MQTNNPTPTPDEKKPVPAGSSFSHDLFSFLKTVSMTVWMVIFSAILLAVAVVFIVVWLNRDNSLRLEQNGKIDITPTQVRSIRDIGEWEFLSVSDEELVDTVRHGFFGDDELVRIYYGTLRLGVNLHEAKPGWLKANKDTIVATLPPVKLLDEDFIDEAKTKSFYEEGSWSQQDREALYRKAYRKMKERCLNSRNIASAEQNAARQFDNLLRSMGFEHVRVAFEKPEKEK